LSHAEQDLLPDAQRAGAQTVRVFGGVRGVSESCFYTWRNRQRKAQNKFCLRAIYAVETDRSTALGTNF